MLIHPTAIVEDGAEVGDGVSIGPLCHVGPNVKLREKVVLKSHVVIEGDTEVGARTVVHPFAVLGGAPQHTAYKGEKTKLIIGEDVLIREHVTMNPGTVAGGGVTRVGNRGFFMIGSHVAHDCQVGDDVIFANNLAIGGHVTIGNGAFLGGLCAIHQFCRVGDYAFIGGCAAVAADVIPYGSAFGNHARLGGLNVIGMKRRGMDRETIHGLRNAYRMLFGNDATFDERLKRVRDEFGGIQEVKRIIDFIDNGDSRPLMTPRG